MHYLEENYPVQREDHKLKRFYLVDSLLRLFVRAPLMYLTHYFEVGLRLTRETTQSTIGFSFRTWITNHPAVSAAGKRAHVLSFSHLNILRYPGDSKFTVVHRVIIRESNREGLVKIQGLSRQDRLLVARKQLSQGAIKWAKMASIIIRAI